MTRAEQIAAVLAEHWSYEPTKDFDAWLCECGARILGSNEGDLDAAMQAHVAAALDAALAAQEGERGGAEVAAAERAVAAVGVVLGLPWHWTAGRTLHAAIRRALADPAGALAKHDAGVLRAAADDLLMPRFAAVADWLRERADSIEAQS